MTINLDKNVTNANTHAHARRECYSGVWFWFYLPRGCNNYLIVFNLLYIRFKLVIPVIIWL